MIRDRRKLAGDGDCLRRGEETRVENNRTGPNRRIGQMDGFAERRESITRQAVIGVAVLVDDQRR